MKHTLVFALPAVLAAALAAQQGAVGSPEAWRGPLGLGILVTDESGQGIPGAIVALRFSDDASAGPPLMETDADGRVEISSLAAGEWQADVRRDGYMLYTAYLDLGAGQEPEVGFRTRQRTGSFWAPLEVRFYDPEERVDVGGIRLLSEEQRRKEERRLAKKEKQRRKREERPDVAVIVEEPPPPEVAQATAPEAAPRQSAAAQGAAATPAAEGRDTDRERAATPVAVPPEEAEMPTAVEEPPVAQPPVPRGAGGAEKPSPAAPAPQAEVRPSARPQEAAAPPAPAEPAEPREPAKIAAPVVPPPSAAEVPSVETPRPAVPAEPPEPARIAKAAEPAEPAEPLKVAEPAVLPPSAVEVHPVETPRPAAPAAVDRPAAEPPPLRLPTIRPNPRLLPAGACPECRSGEWSLAAEGVAAPRTDDDCDDDLASRLEEASKLVIGALPPELRDFAGSLVDPGGDDDVLRLLPPASGRLVASRLAPVVDAAGSCQAVGVVLPRGARYIGFRYQAADANAGLGECPPEGECQIGEARWRGNPVLERTPELTVVYAVFENLSQVRERRPRLIVYFQPRPGWAPPSR